MQRACMLVCALILLTAAQVRAQKTQFEYRFDSERALQDWQVNQDVVERRIENGALAFTCRGPDPILVFALPMNVPASARQALEIRMQADRDGPFEVFWSGTTEGRYGGFSGEKRTPFTVRGDGQFRTYRLFPFWQKEGKIVRLRLDPYDGATFRIASIRIVEAAGGDRLRAPSFVFRRQTDGWAGMHNVALHPEAGAMRMTLQAGDGFALSPPIESDALRAPLVSLRLASTAKNAAILFATDRTPGLHTLSFPLIPDGKPHTYNLDMLNAPDWQGRIIAIGLRPGEAVGDTVRLEWLRLSDRPQGGAELRPLWFSVEEALPRAGVPVSVRARLTNAGGAPIRGLRATLRLPAGARLLKTERAAEPALEFGQETDLVWRVLFPQPTTARLSLRITGSNIPPQTLTAVERITPRASSTNASYVPEPKPVRGRYPVGVYYFPGWRSPGQWVPITYYPERRPALGWYREGDTEIIDWQIKWAVEHGITFFAYDWYWSQGARQLEHGLQAYLRSRYRKYLQFCLLWANHNPPNTSSREDLRNVTQHWIENYFRQPGHLQIDGKPVMIIFTPERLREDMGSAAVRESFEEMREMCRAQGLKGLYLIACVPGASGVKLAYDEGYDAVTCYNWAGLGVEGTERRAPYDTLIEGYRREWQQIVDRGLLPLMPPISGGWDSRPWHGNTALVRYGRTPEKFQRHLQDAKRFLDANPQTTLPMILIEAWNEWGEGSYIEPHREFGFGYLDAIRRVFTDASPSHTDLTPADVGRTAAQVVFPAPTRARWDFREGLLGWDSMMNLTPAKIEDGALTADATGDDPALSSPQVFLPAHRYYTLHIRLRLQPPDNRSSDDVAQLFWVVRGGATSEAASVKIPVRLDGQWRDYVVRLADNPRWRGNVTALRFDPCSRPGTRVQIQRIEMR